MRPFLQGDEFILITTDSNKDTMKITYQKLAKTLQRLEAQFGGNSTHSYSGAAKSAIRPTDNFQCFALDTTTSSGDPELPVVIAVGANYTQGTPSVNP